MVKATMTREEVNEMIATVAKNFNYSVDELRNMAQDGSLHEPELRDFWLIWGDTPLQPAN